ncbi:uncharacterized protein LOC118436571 [Folsomia candida]|uniref:uncharacterized protein LOC118436571 n=1 Tax=Folsomia candida TaxID=158441 RepID=UPI0016052443|nr:uncharacterized protein LOC118436571 [Folsomia candida]
MAHSSSLSAPLKCSVCLDVCMPGEIQQCKNGHNICASHLPHLRDCPICRIPFSHGLARNLVAEYLVGLPVERRSQQVEDMARKIASIVTTPTVHSSVGLSSNNFPYNVTIVISPSSNNAGNDDNISCKYTAEGCTYRNAASHMQQHEINCDYRPIKCCLKTERCCYNGQIPFSEYIQHLITTHNVKCFEGSPCLIIYYVKEDRKLVQDGPTDLVILEVDKNKFLVRAKQVEDRVYIWVAFHGAPQDGCKYMATIKFDFPDDDDDCRKIQENGGDVS